MYVEPCRDPRSFLGSCVRRESAGDDPYYECRTACLYGKMKEVVDTATEKEYGVGSAASAEGTGTEKGTE